jgi:predicted extracellular nuclease
MAKRQAAPLLVAGLLVALSSFVALAAISISTTTPFLQDFNAIGTSATATLPADFRVDRTATSTAADVRRVLTWAAAGSQTTQAGSANLSTSAANGIYNFGVTAASTERAIGFLASGTATASGNLYAELANNTGAPLSGLSISYNVEKYRNGSNANGFRIQLFWSDDGITWTSAGSAFMTAFPADASNNGFAVAPGATVQVNDVLNITIQPGASFYLAWNYSVTAGNTVTNAQALAVDDISILGLEASNPSAQGSADPPAVVVGAQTTLSATAFGGSSPPSTGLVVSCDLTALGGSATFNLPNTSGNTYSAPYTVPLGTPGQHYLLPCAVSDDQGRSGSFTIALDVTVPFLCETGAKTSTAIHAIQGSGLSSPLANQIVEVEGIVVGSFQASSQLNGFYLQEPDATWDADTQTSEGVFVFDPGAPVSVTIGDRVRVKGTVNEFSSSGSFLGVTRASTITEIQSVQNRVVCSTGNAFTRTVVTLPTAGPTDLEQFEGMAVSIEQPLTVTGNFSLGTFDQLDLAPSVVFTPTSTPDQSTWAAQTSLIARSVIALDDASTLANANLFPTIFPAGGLSATNTLRVGAKVNFDPNTGTTAPLIGVLDDRFGEYRIQPTAPVTFFEANPRPDVAPLLTGVAARFRAVSANVLNFFTTLNKRGAATQTEFDHQKIKVIEELGSLDGDVYGLSEVQNFANGNTNGGTYTNAALQSLVDGLNCRHAGDVAGCASPPSGPYGFIDTVPLGAANGTDAIRSAIIYRTDRLAPVGGPAIYNQNDTNRPTLAQTFQPASGPKASQQTFTFVVNHFRSKGSACGGGLDDQFQGNCNGLRLLMAQNVVAWLSGNPTSDPAGTNRRILVVGDFNAYFGEDPIQFFLSQGYANLINALIGPAAYSFNFGSERGYLDHAMVNAPMNALVKNVAEWHNNSDEPSSLEALDSSNKSAQAQIAYFGADPFAASDHDPIVIGFNTLAGDLNDDGVVDSTDQRLLAGAIGKKTVAVDRRMDFDGDGQITLNDYRLWTALYRAFIQ